MFHSQSIYHPCIEILYKCCFLKAELCVRCRHYKAILSMRHCSAFGQCGERLERFLVGVLVGECIPGDLSGTNYTFKL